MARLLAGTSGWVYEHWKGVFYPPDLPEDRWFSYYASKFDTVEINNSFYRLPSRGTFEGWRRGAPPGFLFTVKASRYITHTKKLKDPETGVANFYGNLEGMGEACACVLFQLPPHWKANLERLQRFLQVVPKRHRIAFEFREESWLAPETYALLGEHNAALVAADSPFYPAPDERTADFDFFRMHGGHRRVRPKYTEAEIAGLARTVGSRLAAGRDVFVYFNNDYAGYAVEGALRLKELVARREGDNGAGASGGRGKAKVP